MRSNAFINWYGTDDVFMYGDPPEICTGLCGILAGACKHLDTDLENLITMVYTAMQGIDPDLSKIEIKLEGREREDARTIVRFDRDGFTMTNGTTAELISAVAVLTNKICKTVGMKPKDFATMLYLGMEFIEKDSAPADGSDTGAEEGDII